MKKINEILKHNFKDESLLKTALTHSSKTADTGEVNYERLEYLGDAILGAVVAKYLYTNFNIDAGNLSKYRAKLVNANVLASVIKELGIDEFICVGKSVKNLSENICADVYESLLAGIYLDGGDYVQYVQNTLLKSKQHVLDILDSARDYKTELQEELSKKHSTFEYKIVSKHGEGADSIFEVALIIDDVEKSRATAKSIRLAEQTCAKMILK